jgi:hypothetical protein
MDPSSYSDAPEGDWSTGREKAAGMVMVRQHNARAAVYATVL